MSRTWQLIWRLAAAALNLLIVPFVALAHTTPSRGHALAQKYCAECHVIAPSASRGWTDAPAFDAIANKPGTTVRSLSTFIQQPHMHMENTGRPPAEADEIAAYILTLRKR